MTHYKLLLLPTCFLLLTMTTSMGQTPGGVANNLYLWVEGGAGVIQVGGNVSQWTNLAPTLMTTQPLKVATANVTYVTNGINFNPVIRYDGTSNQMLTGQYLLTPTQPALIFAVANGHSGSSNVGDPYSNASEGAMGMIYDETTGIYWVDGAGNECSPTIPSFNQPVVIRVAYASAANTSGAVTASNGLSNAVCANTALSPTNGQFEIGGRTWGGFPGRVFLGDLGEVVYYNGNTATATQIQQIESYLALKYGITLGNTGSPVNYIASDGVTSFWTGNATYQNDVFGLARDNSSGLIMTSSNSMNSGGGNGTGQSGKLNNLLSTGSPLSTGQFLMIGNDAGAIAEQTTNLPVAATGSSRVTRTWKVQNTGNVGPVNLSIDITGLTFTGGTTASNYRLMINNNGTSNFTTGTQTYYTPATITGNLINFSGISLPNGVAYTLITMAVGTSLPLDFLDFTATALNTSIALHWTTARQMNVDHFDIEHSQDGITYSVIGSIPVDEGASPEHTYTYTDQGESSSGIHYYRIREVDKDGRYSYSVIDAIRLDGAPVLQIQSHGIRGSIWEGQVLTTQTGTMHMILTNTEGQPLGKWDKALHAGLNTINANISDLAAGIYIFRFEIEGKTTTLKIFKP